VEEFKKLFTIHNDFTPEVGREGGGKGRRGRRRRKGGRLRRKRGWKRAGGRGRLVSKGEDPSQQRRPLPCPPSLSPSLPPSPTPGGGHLPPGVSVATPESGRWGWRGGGRGGRGQWEQHHRVKRERIKVERWGEEGM